MCHTRAVPAHPLLPCLYCLVLYSFNCSSDHQVKVLLRPSSCLLPPTFTIADLFYLFIDFLHTLFVFRTGGELESLPACTVWKAAVRGFCQSDHSFLFLFLKGQCLNFKGSFCRKWLKLNTMITSMFSLVYNHLKIRIIVFSQP